MAKHSLPNPFSKDKIAMPHNGRFNDLTGQTFGRLSVVQFAGVNKHHHAIWMCRCACGGSVTTEGTALRKGFTKSCGCLVSERSRTAFITHGETANAKWTPEYRSFHEAKARCNNPSRNGYARYGGRGIEFRFESFEQFLDEIGRRPSSDFSLDRIDNDGHYEPGNVRWADRKTQAANRRPRRRRI